MTKKQENLESQQHATKFKLTKQGPKNPLAEGPSRKPGIAVSEEGPLSPLLSKILEIEHGRFDGHSYDVDETPYVFFSPSRHFRSGLIDESVLTSLLGGKTLLSVGCGPAYLEQMLVMLGVPRQNIVLVDRKKVDLADIDGNGVPADMEFHEFDMLSTWPALGRKFDYVIFPDSFSVVFDILWRSITPERYSTLPQAAFLAEFNREHKYDMNIHDEFDSLEAVYLFTEVMTPRRIIDLQQRVIISALDSTVPGGQVRIGGNQIDYNQLCYLHYSLHNEYQSLSVSKELSVITK